VKTNNDELRKFKDNATWVATVIKAEAPRYLLRLLVAGLIVAVIAVAIVFTKPQWSKIGQAASVEGEIARGRVVSVDTRLHNILGLPVKKGVKRVGVDVDGDGKADGMVYVYSFEPRYYEVNKRSTLHFGENYTREHGPGTNIGGGIILADKGSLMLPPVYDTSDESYGDYSWMREMFPVNPWPLLHDEFSSHLWRHMVFNEPDRVITNEIIGQNGKPLAALDNGNISTKGLEEFREECNRIEYLSIQRFILERRQELELERRQQQGLQQWNQQLELQYQQQVLELVYKLSH